MGTKISFDLRYLIRQFPLIFDNVGKLTLEFFYGQNRCHSKPLT